MNYARVSLPRMHLFLNDMVSGSIHRKLYYIMTNTSRSMFYECYSIFAYCTHSVSQLQVSNKLTLLCPLIIRNISSYTLLYKKECLSYFLIILSYQGC